MREEWEKYLLSKVELKGYQGRHKGAKKKTKEPKGIGILDGVVPRTGKEDAEVSSTNKQENDALLAAASAVKKLSKKEATSVDTCQQNVVNEENAPGKRKGKSEKPLQEKQGIEKHNNNRRKSKSIDKSQVASPVNEDEITGDNTISEDGLLEGEQRTLLAENGVLRRHTEDISADAPTSQRTLPPVHFHALESDQPILDILKPSVIIAYHPDITFVREVEVYNAENPSKKLKVYFLFYEDSTEVQKFEASIRRENGAFESLIRQKSMMMIPVNLVCSFLLLAIII